MSDACTVVCHKFHFSRLKHSIEENTDGHVSSRIENGFNVIQVDYPQSRIKFTPLVFKEPGDQFGRTYVSMLNYFENIKTDAEENRRRILSFVEDADTMIGVLAEPGYSEIDGHFDLIFAVAKDLNSMLFNGSAMFDPDGNIILDADGSRDI